ncbi:hypothetical protein ACQP1S_27390 [Micromonospora matsumotoense]|uniref:hypothetical protein n=1 Tax=Micromonospora matsumotoense TaxID=121616 RepID=UPI003D8DA8F1
MDGLAVRVVRLLPVLWLLPVLRLLPVLWLPVLRLLAVRCRRLLAVRCLRRGVRVLRLARHGLLPVRVVRGLLAVRVLAGVSGLHLGRSSVVVRQ